MVVRREGGAPLRGITNRLREVVMRTRFKRRSFAVTVAAFRSDAPNPKPGERTMSDERIQTKERRDSTQFEYGRSTWWAGFIQSYGAMEMALHATETEQNHLVHAAFLKKGPAKTRHLWRYVPAITLSQAEHRGARFSFHHLKDLELCGSGGGSFLGCGMDAFLRSRGVYPRKTSFSEREVSEAIDASSKYWSMIGMEHASAAIRQFKREVFENPVYHGAHR